MIARYNIALQAVKSNDILPLLRHAWLQEYKGLKIQFECDKRTCGEEETLDLDLINTLFRNVAARAHDDWRMYSRLQKVLKSVIVSPSRSEVTFTLSSKSKGTSWEVEDTFRLTDQDGIARVPKPELHTTLGQVMRCRNIGSSIMAYLRQGQGPIVFDLDKRTSSEPYPSIMAVDKNARWSAIDAFSQDLTIFRMTSTESQSSFGNYQALKKLLTHRGNRVIERFDFPAAYRSPCVSLRFALSGPLEGKDIRFEALQLCLLLSSRYQMPRREIRVEFQIDGDSNETEQKTIESHDLRKPLMIFIRELYDKHETDEEVLNAPLKIWLDWSGQICDAEVTRGDEQITIGRPGRIDWTEETAESEKRRSIDRFSEIREKYEKRGNLSLPRTP